MPVRPRREKGDADKRREQGAKRSGGSEIHKGAILGDKQSSEFLGVVLSRGRETLKSARRGERSGGAGVRDSTRVLLSEQGRLEAMIETC